MPHDRLIIYPNISFSRHLYISMSPVIKGAIVSLKKESAEFPHLDSSNTCLSPKYISPLADFKSSLGLPCETMLSMDFFFLKIHSSYLSSFLCPRT